MLRCAHTATADMKNANVREEEYFSADFSEALAEIGVFVVEEKSLVKTVYAEEVMSGNGKGCTTRPADKFRFPGFSKRFFGTESEMVSEDIPESGRVPRIPFLRGFEFAKKAESDTSDAWILLEIYNELLKIAREKSCVGIEEYQDVSASVFRCSIHRKAESAIVGEWEECEGETALECAERFFFRWVVICDEYFV